MRLKKILWRELNLDYLNSTHTYIKVKTNMILDSKKKITLILISRKEIMIENQINKGIKIYIDWLENENKCKVEIENYINMTKIISEKKLNIICPSINK